MKKIILFSLIIIGIYACKKDKITVNENKTFEEINVSPSSDPMYSNAMIVLLTPNGTGGLSFGSDAIMPATYKITGKTLKIYQNNKTYKLHIISESELQYQGKILRLR